MALFNRRGNDTDPFNAGEPIMPWDDPTSTHDIDECVFGGEAYRPPAKPTDDYAPSAKRPNRSEQTATEDNRDRTKKAKKTGRKNIVRQNKTSAKATASHTTDSMAENLQQIDHIGHKVHRGRRALIAIAAFIVAINLIGGFLASCTSLIVSIASDALDDVDTHVSRTYSNDQDDDYGDMVDDTNRESQSKNAVEDYANELLSDTEELDAAYSERLNERLKFDLGYTADELGINAQDYCEWARERTQFAIGNAYTYEKATFVYFDTEYPYLSELSEAFCDDAESYLDEEGLDGSYADDNHGDPLNDRQKEHMQKLFSEALSKMDETFGGSGCILLTEKDGEWVFDDDAFRQELYRTIGLG